MDPLSEPIVTIDINEVTKILNNYLNEKGIIDIIIDYEGTRTIYKIKAMAFNHIKRYENDELIPSYNWNYLINKNLPMIMDSVKILRKMDDHPNDTEEESNEKLSHLIELCNFNNSENPLLIFGIDLCDLMDHVSDRQYRCDFAEVRIFLQQLYDTLR